MSLLVDKLDPKRMRKIAFMEGRPNAYAIWLDSAHHVFEVSNVAQAAKDQDHPEWFTNSGTSDVTVNRDAFTDIAPPFQNYWMEWVVPKELRTVRRGLTQEVVNSLVIPKRFAVMIAHVTLSDDSPSAIIDPDGNWHLSFLVWGMHDHDEPCALLHSCFPVNASTGKVTGECPHHGSVLGNDGLKYIAPEFLKETKDHEAEIEDYAKQLEKEMRFVPEADREEWLLQRGVEIHKRAEEAQRSMDEATESIRTVLARMVKYLAEPVVLMAHELMACKNVETDVHHRPERLIKKRSKRGGTPVVTFKTLRIGPKSSSSRNIGLRVGDGQVAMHIVHGHFKTYTTEKPLLGKHVGKYYWSPHVRGKAEAGVVVKDYVVEGGEGA